MFEQAMLEQTKKQAVIFLRDLEEELQRVPAADADELQRLIVDAGRHIHDTYDFSVYQIYAVAADGDYLAHSDPDASRVPKDMSGYLGEVLRTGLPYMGGAVEWKSVGDTGKISPVIDIVIPLRHRGVSLGILEVEIDVDETLATIKSLDDRFEREIVAGGLVTFAIMLAFLLWVVQRGLIRPIRHLADVTQRISRGEIGARATLRGADELGELGASVNDMADSIERLLDEQERAYIESLQSLAKALEAKDAYTSSHSGRVAKYAVLLGRQAGLSPEELRLLKQGSMMHDLGKIGIPDAILNKPSALDEREYEIMQGHPEATYAIMKPLTRFRQFAEIARWHHERWDGKGYPDGLAGDDIPLLARIVAIADTWDAMTGDRVYRKGMPIEKALSIMEKERNDGQWDPQLLDLFIGMIRGEQDARAEVEEDLFPDAANDAARG
ncbi:MAG: HD-GYP domain-containing protein [Ectothiorhodospiraceae bacterium]|nr:HD-GYP domain-containing protein [Ectothiorhodospiraceae bacterium]